MTRPIFIGTRGSDLALWQANFVKAELESRQPDKRFEIKIISTAGDRLADVSLSKIGDKGLFTRAIEEELQNGDIDLAVHSLKDLPTRLPDGVVIGAVAKRETPNDVLITKEAASLWALGQNARVATGSLRRRSQLLSLRPDVEVKDIRGNVPTRIARFLEYDIDAMILAYAGLHRLKLDEYIRQVIPVSEMLPAVGQGAIAVEIRDDDQRAAAMAAAINDRVTQSCVTAERSFLRVLEGGCQVPIGAHAVRSGAEILLEGFVGSLDGSRVIKEGSSGSFENPEDLGQRLAEACIELGAHEILSDARSGPAGAE